MKTDQETNACKRSYAQQTGLSTYLFIVLLTQPNTILVN